MKGRRRECRRMDGEKRREGFSRWEQEGEGGGTETKCTYMTASNCDKYVKERKRAARGTKSEKKRDRDEDVVQ